MFLKVTTKYFNLYLCLIHANVTISGLNSLSHIAPLTFILLLLFLIYSKITERGGSGPSCLEAVVHLKDN